MKPTIDLKTLRLSMNTDSVDIELSQIGVHTNQGRPNRGLCIGVKHSRTDQSVRDATEVARLIAAAPELLEALINCSRRFDKYDEQDAPELVANVRSAIAKATGGAE